MTQTSKPAFPDQEFAQRRLQVRRAMAEQGLDGLLVSSPENVYYLCGLDHMGYFAVQLLLLPLEGDPVLVTRAMERATIADQVPHLSHRGYADGSVRPGLSAPGAVVDPADPLEDSAAVGEIPWMGTVSVPVGNALSASGRQPPAAVQVTCEALEEAGLAAARIGLEKGSSFLPPGIAEGIATGAPRAVFDDASGLVDRQRFVQSPRELAFTRRAATLSDSMMLAAIAAAGPGVHVRDVMAAIYDAMFRRGGTYPGFVPLVRTQRTLEHEHGTWQDVRLAASDILFLEMAGCIRRYHAPMGRLVFIGRSPRRAARINDVCRRAMDAVVDCVGPGVRARDAYAAWQAVLDEAGLADYVRHHCGYSVGIGFPPSWSGSGVPVGLRPDSDMRLEAGMVFHVLSWLLRSGRGDAFLSDTVVVTGSGCDVLTTVDRGVLVR